MNPLVRNFCKESNPGSSPSGYFRGDEESKSHIFPLLLEVLWGLCGSAPELGREEEPRETAVQLQARVTGREPDNKHSNIPCWQNTRDFLEIQISKVNSTCQPAMLCSWEAKSLSTPPTCLDLLTNFKFIDLWKADYPPVWHMWKQDPANLVNKPKVGKSTPRTAWPGTRSLHFLCTRLQRPKSLSGQWISSTRWFQPLRSHMRDRDT